MSLVKIEINFHEISSVLEAFAKNQKIALKGLVDSATTSVGQAIERLLHQEMEIFLGRQDQAENKQNGFYERQYAIKGLGAIRFKMPRDRKGEFKSVVVGSNERMDPRLKEDLAMLHLAGLSTRTLAMISNRLLGLEVSAKTVSNSLECVREGAEKWLDRPLTKRYWALYVDGTNFNIQRRGSTEKEPSLVVLGVGEDNCKSILAIEPGTRDDANAWRMVFAELKRRGLDPSAVRIGIMDGLSGLERVFREEFPNAVTARCWFHAMGNACEKSPKRLRDSFELLANRVMYATSEDGSRKAFAMLKEQMGRDAERAVACLEKDLESLLTHYKFEQKYWRALKTTNSIERINKELKRRTKTMESVGESTLKSVVVFTALRLEMGWRMKPIDSKTSPMIRIPGQNVLTEAASEMGLLN